MPVVQAASLALAALILADQSSPREAWGASHLDYGGNDHRVKNPDIRSHFYYDTKTTGEYVARAMKPGDLVITRDGPGTIVYSGQVDYVLRRTPYDGFATTRTGAAVDRNVGAPILDSVSVLEGAIEGHRGDSVWVIVSVPYGDRPIVNLPAGVPEWLELKRDRVVYRGRDGNTLAYRFEATAKGNPVSNPALQP